MSYHMLYKPTGDSDKSSFESTDVTDTYLNCTIHMANPIIRSELLKIILTIYPERPEKEIVGFPLKQSGFWIYNTKILIWSVCACVCVCVMCMHVPHIPNIVVSLISTHWFDLFLLSYLNLYRVILYISINSFSEKSLTTRKTQVQCLEIKIFYDIYILLKNGCFEELYLTNKCHYRACVH